MTPMRPRNREPKTYQSSIANQLAGKPQEGLLEVIIRLGRNVVVLEVLFPVEGDGLGFDLALLDIDLVAAENDGDVLADAGEITWSRR
jgi:hypothetical protein